MSICDGCIHDNVCGLEDNHEEGIISCADRIPKDVINKNGTLHETVTEFADRCRECGRERVLDKIRAEIEQCADKQIQIAMGVADLNERYTHIQVESAYRHSLNIIDKYKEYKAESEDREWAIE